jgi:hypothetical protein
MRASLQTIAAVPPWPQQRPVPYRLPSLVPTIERRAGGIVACGASDTADRESRSGF